MKNKQNQITSLFSFLLIIIASPCFGVIYFESSWNQLTGNSTEALTDGMRFTGGCARNELMNVETGGIAGNNLMGIWLNGEQWGHTGVYDLPIEQYDDFYYRFYVRVYPKINGTDTIKYPNFHGIQNYDNNGYPSNFYFSVRDEGNPNSWTFGMGTYAAQPDSIDRGYLFWGALKFNEWYRVEGHIHWDNHTAWAAPTKWLLKVYNASGALVADESNLYGLSTKKQLKASYDEGKRLYIDGGTNRWTMGTNGPYMGKGYGRIHDISCVALGSDPSVFGPVTKKVADIDSFLPTSYGYYPVKNAAGVSPTNIITIYVGDIGLGVDSTSITMKVNGSPVTPAISGSRWNYKLFYKSPSPLPSGEKITIEVNARDKAGNSMVPLNYTFTTSGTSVIQSNNPFSITSNIRNLSGSLDQILYNVNGQKVQMNSSTQKNSLGQSFYFVPSGTKGVRILKIQ